MAAWVERTIGGRAISAIMIDAQKNDLADATPDPGTSCERKTSCGLEKIARPNSATTMLGTPKIRSIAVSVICLSHLGLPCSPRKMAVVNPSGSAISVPRPVTISVPMSGETMPPATPISTEPGEGFVVKKAQSMLRRPLTRSQATIAKTTPTRKIPNAQAK